MMRITIDIDAKQLATIQKATGTRKKSPAIRRALEQFLLEIEKKEFLRKVLAGETDYSMTNEELEARGAHDSD